MNFLLTLVEQRRITRLIITLAPRHGKSELISKYFPAYYLCKNPTHRVILASYEAEFAAEWGRKVRDIVEVDGKRLFGISLRQDSKAADHWMIANHGGGMQTCGVGGALTGKGSDVLLIDDPFKNAEEANSELIRTKKFDWFTTAAYTRLEPNGVIILVNTRWHELDIAGRLMLQMKEGGEQWTLLHLPALSDGPEVRARLTLPGDEAARQAVIEGMKFNSLDDYLWFAA